MFGLVFMGGVLLFIGSLISKALATIPGISLVPLLGELVAWGSETAYLLMPIGIFMAVFAMTRNFLFGIGAVIIFEIVAFATGGLGGLIL